MPGLQSRDPFTSKVFRCPIFIVVVGYLMMVAAVPTILGSVATIYLFHETANSLPYATSVAVRNHMVALNVPEPVIEKAVEYYRQGETPKKQQVAGQKNTNEKNANIQGAVIEEDQQKELFEDPDAL